MNQAVIAMQQCLLQYAQLLNASLCITDAQSEPQYSAGENRLWFASARLETYAYPGRVWTLSREPSVCLACASILDMGKPRFQLFVYGDGRNSVASAAKTVKIALEGLLAAGDSDDGSADDQAYTALWNNLLVQSLLSGQPDAQAAGSLMRRFDLDSSLMRAVICIQLSFQTNRYFNVNLNLGYLPQIEQARGEIIALLRGNRYLNAQDICAEYGENQIVVLKSFVPTTDMSKLYRALAHICEDMTHSLQGRYLLDVKGAYGSAYAAPSQLPESYREARELLRIGRREMPEQSAYSPGQLFTSSMFSHIPPQARAHTLQPALQKLMVAYPKSYRELVFSCEVFVDACMNYSKAAQTLGVHRNTLNARLLRAQAATGLDPTNRFTDALILKFMALSLRDTSKEDTTDEGKHTGNAPA